MTAAASPVRPDQPGWLDPELATLTQDRFSDPGWIFERKLDGERCLAFRSGRGIRLMTRNQKEDTSTYPEITEALAAQRAGDFIIDGEIVAFDGSQTRFARLQQRLGVRQPGPDLLAGVPVCYYVFDVLWADGRDMRPLPLRERKQILRDLLTFTGPLRFTEHTDTDGEAYFRQACASGWEGVIAKRADAPYRAWPDPGLAEVQVRERPGIRHRRLHRPAREPHRVRRAAAGLLRPGSPARIRRQSRYRLQPADPGQPARDAGRPGAGPSPVRPRPAAAVRRALGGAPPGRRGGLQRMDDRRGAAPPPVPGPARRQGPRRCRPGDAAGQHPVKTPPRTLTQTTADHAARPIVPTSGTPDRRLCARENVRRKHHVGRTYRPLRCPARRPGKATSGRYSRSEHLLRHLWHRSAEPRAGMEDQPRPMMVTGLGLRCGCGSRRSRRGAR